MICKWSLPLTSNASTAVIFLFSSPSVTISGSSSNWLASSTAELIVSITSAIFLLLVSCLYSTISGLIADKDVQTSMSKSMYSSMTVLEKSWLNNSRNSASIYINLIIFFKTTKSTRIPLLTFEKHKSKHRKITRKGNGSQRD